MNYKFFKSKDLEKDLTPEEFIALQSLIEKLMRKVDNLQTIHKKITGQKYVPPVRW